MNWSTFWELFHNGWGQAKGSPEYNKQTFNSMQHMLKNLQDGIGDSGVKMITMPERRKQERRK